VGNRLQTSTGLNLAEVYVIRVFLLLLRGIARNLLRGTNQGVWGTDVSRGVQGQNMETLENTNRVVTKIDLR